MALTGRAAVANFNDVFECLRMPLLSDRAGALYADLVRADGIPLCDVGPDDPALAELHRSGLAWTSPHQQVRPVSPDLALGKLLTRRQRELVDRHTELLADYERLAELGRATGRCEHANSPHLDLLQSAEEVAEAQCELQASALKDYRAVELPWLVSASPAGLRRRIIGTTDFIGRNALGDCGAQEVRAVCAPPMKLLVADRLGLVILTAAGAGAGMVVRAPVAVRALKQYFDLVWDSARPVSGPAVPHDRADALPKGERVMLTMLVAGLTDDAIARNLNISSRSVRRHVAALEERAGVRTRFALGAAAVRLGWVAQ
jgi:DNA-binding CsgD family transcriptional regulator